jgi:hypothetical protein
MATNGADERPSIFAVYIEELPPARKAQRPSQAQRMLDWLQRWDKPIVNRRDVRIYGPSSVRDRKSMISSAEILVRYGWLVPIEPRRYDGFRWRIVRKLVAHPTISNS